MATYVYDDFRVTFTPRTDGEDGRYGVRVDRSVGDAVDADFQAPVGEELESLVLGVARSRAALRTRRATTEAPTAEPAAPEPSPLTDPVAAAALRTVGANLRREVDGAALGTRIADALFAGPIGDAYQEALANVQGTDRGVRLTLSLGAAPRLLSIPWEFLRREKLFLASQRHTPVVRQIETGVRVAPPSIEDVVRILAVIASPTDLSPLDVAQERERVAKAVSAVEKMGRVQVDWLEPATRSALRTKLADGKYHVLHYVGHSAFEDGEGRLFLEKAGDRTKDPVDTEWLANVIADERQLRLAVLNSCEGARTSVEDPYAGVAATLLQVGVPAVVAMQFEISDAVAILFAEELYTNLIARQLPVDAAVAEARKAVLGDLDSPEFATPVLFVQDPDVALFDFRRRAEALPELPAPGAEGGRTLPPELAVPLPDGASKPARPRWLVPAAIGAAALAVLVVLFVVLSRGGDGPTGRTAVTTTTVTAAEAEFPTLRLGAGGPAVEAAQWLLVADGAEITPSGFFDHETGDAVTAFDQAHRLPADSILGPLTWSELVPSVRVGATGDDVRAAQLLLNVNGADIAEDGRFGPLTEAATADFERRHDLHVDGIVDIDVWRLLTANAPDDPTATPPEAVPASVPTASTVPTTVVDATAPRPPSGFLAFAVEDGTGTHLRTVDPDDPAAPPGPATNREGAVDTGASWQPGTNRLAFSRAEPAVGDDVGVFYVVPGNGRGDRGKTVDRLITGRSGSERLPAWAADDGLYYVATDGCVPADDPCDDSLRLAHFDVGDAQAPSDEPGHYLDDVLSQDTLTLTEDVRVAGPFQDVTAVAAHPLISTRAAVLDAQGLWLVADATPTLVQPGLAGHAVSFTRTGSSIVVAGPSAVTLLDATGVVRSTTTVAELAAAADSATPMAPGATVTSIDLAGGDGRMVAFVDDDSDGLPGVVATLAVSGDVLAIEDVRPTPTAISHLGPVLTVAV